MRASEILRKLADVIDSAEGNQSTSLGTSPEPVNHAELTAVNVSQKDDTGKVGVFVPPLQAKIELLKKSVNVDSVYDETGPDEDLTGHGDDNEDNELDRIKKLSGMTIVAQHEAADDEPLDV